MNSNSILLIDPTFDPSSSTTSRLLIKIGLDAFSYAIVNNETRKVTVLYDEQECEDGSTRFAEKMKTDSYLRLIYHEVKIQVSTNHSITVPNSLFNEEDLSLHAPFLGLEGQKKIYKDHQPSFDFTNVFALPLSLDSIVAEEFPNSTKYPECAGLLAIVKSEEKPTLIIDFTVGSINLVYVRAQQLQFQRSFETSNIDELNYYLLLMIDTLQIHTEETSVLLCGIIHENDEKQECVKKYFSQIQFYAENDGFDTEVIEDMPPHYYSNLLALYRCG